MCGVSSLNEMVTPGVLIVIHRRNKLALGRIITSTRGDRHAIWN